MMTHHTHARLLSASRSRQSPAPRLPALAGPSRPLHASASRGAPASLACAYPAGDAAHASLAAQVDAFGVARPSPGSRKARQGESEAATPRHPYGSDLDEEPWALSAAAEDAYAGTPGARRAACRKRTALRGAEAAHVRVCTRRRLCRTEHATRRHHAPPARRLQREGARRAERQRGAAGASASCALCKSKAARTVRLSSAHAARPRRSWS